MDFNLTSEQEMLRDAIATIAADFGHDYFAERTKAGEHSTELWQTLGRHGYVGLNTPEEYGGGGLGLSELCILCEEVAAAGSPLLLLVVSQAIGATLIAQYGTEAQKKWWLPPLASGEKIMAFAITEPDAGSNSHNIATTAARDGDVYRINGRKTFISGVDEADWILLVTRTGVDEQGRAKLSLFVVDTEMAGFEKAPIDTVITAPERQWLLFYDNAEVPADRMLGEENEGLRAVFFGLNPERITSAAMASGLSRYALGKASQYANDRSVWGAPIGTHQGLAHPLAITKIEADMAKLMMQKAAWLYDQGRPCAAEANMAKYAAAEAAIHCLDQSIQVHGGNGLTQEYGIADLWPLARLMRTAPISREMILNFVAQHTLGLPKSY